MMDLKMSKPQSPANPNQPPANLETEHRSMSKPSQDQENCPAESNPTVTEEDF